MKCENCGADMQYIETKEMGNKMWDKYQCNKCKDIVYKEAEQWFKK